LGKAEVVVDVSGVTMNHGGRVHEVDVEREFELSTECGDATENVSAVDGTAVPSVGGATSGLDENVAGSDVAIGSSDGDRFVQDAKEALH